MDEKSFEFKIAKWESEREKLLKKKDAIEEKIEALEQKITQGKRALEAEKNKKIVAVMEEVLGPLGEKNLDDLKLELMILSEEKNQMLSSDAGDSDFFKKVQEDKIE